MRVESDKPERDVPHASGTTPARVKTPVRVGGVGSRGSARERLLVAATELFYQRGVNGAGIDAVIARAGVAKMSLYKHFKSKDELIAACLRRVSDEWLAWIAAEVDRHAGPALGEGVGGAEESARRGRAEARIEAMFDAVYEWCAARQFRGCPFLNAAAELADSAHPGHAAALAHKMRFRGLVAREAADAGARDAGALAHQLVILIDGSVSCAAVTGNLEGLERAKQAGGVLVREGRGG